MDICTLSSRFIEPRVRYKGMKTFIIGRKAKKVYREVKMHVCYKKLREIKLFWRLRPVSKSNWHPSFKIDEIKIFLATKPIYVWKFSCLAVWNVNLENHIKCTFSLLAILSFYPYNIQSIPIHQEKKQLFQSSELQPWKNFRNPEFWILWNFWTFSNLEISLGPAERTWCGLPA